MLLGSQHSTNKMDCFVCGSCFRFIGSIELQIGRKLYFQGLGVSSSNPCHSDSSDAEDDSCFIGDANLGECSASSSNGKIPVSEEVVESLMNGQLVLPHSDKFSLPLPFPCSGGCGEENYCSKYCADIDWQNCHSLLCTGEKSKSSCRRALSKFVEHANDTNDIFILAAKVIAMTSMRYKNLKEARLKEVGSVASNTATVDLSLLLEAWKPVSMGYKRRWWECIALPEDVDKCDEVDFRLQFKELAFESLQLLKAAIFDAECAPLFSLEIYGQIIGMFELNNLDLVVASPVEDYFLYVDDLPQSPRKEVEAVTRPILEALDDDYPIYCQGTAFFPLQSCMNHSCCPNAKAFKRENDRDGQATIVAITPIRIGEQVTISYIDEELPYEERQKLLADYGFRCKCSKCMDEKVN
ncbi:histone-lysine N-methyltransferase ATXR2 isoform X2 [Beta vulgaris subsp. vulgaris]|nr:histone-lysine N-methyltransferase ATXR2 isoform X2 [Beta vulgaris subsp. vulgaris]